MQFVNWSNFWWSNITGANMVVNGVVDALMGGSTVALEVPDDLPWQEEMHRIIETEFRSRSGLIKISVENVDDTVECGNTSPGTFLLENFAHGEVRFGYREGSKKKIQEYIRENCVLKNRVIWVRGLSADRAEEWMSFCRDYKTSTPEDGLFVLEVQGTVARQSSRRLTVVRYAEHVSNYDVQLFNSFILDEDLTLTPEWKTYIATAIAVLCDVDAELAELMLQHDDLKSVSFSDLTAELADDPLYITRGARTSCHLFSYFRSGNTEEIERRIWKAQVQVLFPMIELERIYLINKYKDLIEQALKERRDLNDPVTQYNKEITSYIEVEFGTLCFMMACRYLYIPDQADRNRIHFLHDMRNQIAHAHACPPDTVKGLLDGLS